LKISDLLNLGFDPTRLREFHHEGMTISLKEYLPTSSLPLSGREGSLRKLKNGLRVTVLRTGDSNQSTLLILRDRGTFTFCETK